MTSLTIEEIKNAKSILEEKLLTLVKEFETKCGVIIDDINLYRVTTFGSGYNSIFDISVDIKLLW